MSEDELFEMPSAGRYSSVSGIAKTASFSLPRAVCENFVSAHENKIPVSDQQSTHFCIKIERDSPNSGVFL